MNWSLSPFLKGHVEWRLVRKHVLGPFSLETVKAELTKEWKEYLDTWRVDDENVHMPIMDGDCALPDRFFGARLNSGYKMYLSEEYWKPFSDWWQRMVVTPVYGAPVLTRNLGVAIITNIHLFRLALKYHGRRAS